MEYTVYRLENVVTKKNYIGMTSLEPKVRWRFGYKGKMGDAINNYPFDLCWKKHIEFQTPNKEQALELESELMKWYDSIDNGYNTSSFENSFYKKTEEHRKKISESMTGRTLSEEHRKKLSEAMTGRVLTDEHRKKLSESMKGKICGEVRLRPVLQFSKSGELIAEYSSISEAERCFGCNHICDCCMGKRKSCGGYLWKYKNGGLN